MSYIEESLAGKKIVEVRVKGTCVWLKSVDGDWLMIEVCGDCCSDAFIDAVAFDPQRVTPILTGKTTEISFRVPPTSQEVDDLTFVSFECVSGGRFDLLHRNSSNGYYGNYLTVTAGEEPPEDSENVRTYWFPRCKESVNE